MALNISGARARFRYRAVVRQTVPSHPAAIAARRAQVYLPGNPHPQQAVAAVSVVTLSYHIAQAGCVCVALKLIRKRAKRAINLEAARNLMARRQLAGA